MEPTHSLPTWLQTPQLPTPDDNIRTSSSASKSLTTTIYANLFENALERIMGGTPLTTVVANDHRGIQLGRFLFWISRDPTRRQRYEEACAIAAETFAHELTGIADGVDETHPDGTTTFTVEDVQRSAQRIKARTYLMEKWSPQRYGDTRRVQIDQTTLTANLSSEDLAKMSIDDLKRMAVEMMQRRGGGGEDADVIDVEPTPVERAA